MRKLKLWGEAIKLLSLASTEVSANTGLMNKDTFR